MGEREVTERQTTELLDSETLAALDEGIRRAANGKRWTVEQAFEFARKRRRAWMEVTQNQLRA